MPRRIPHPFRALALIGWFALVALWKAITLRRKTWSIDAAEGFAAPASASIPIQRGVSTPSRHDRERRTVVRRRRLHEIRRPHFVVPRSLEP